jgi:hypothetical protein
MKRRYLRRIGGLLLATLVLAGTAFFSSESVQAQQGRRRVIIVRPNPYRFHRPWGYRSWWHDPWSPYGSMYRQYVFDDSEDAVNKGYKDGFKTGKDDGKKAKSYKPERSHYYHDSGFGNFAEVYRSGFARGYQDGYREGQNQRAG